MTHHSPFSGTWYPASRRELEALLSQRVEESRRRTPHLFRDALAYVVPHAAPEYSGTVAAAVYRSLERQSPERVVVLAFPHRGGLGGIAVPDVHAISTPLGDIELDTEFGGFPRIPEREVCDHSFEIQLPFLQLTVPSARITPLYVGRLDAAARERAAALLAALWKPGVVFLASSDFTHYGAPFHFVPFPADRNIDDRLRELDFECIDAAGSLDSGLFHDTVRANQATVCGTDPIALLLDVLHRLDGDSIYQASLDYQTSGEITGDYESSVSYAALGYYRRDVFALDPSDREALLDVAEGTLRRLRETGVREPEAVQGGSGALGANGGIFVSLHHGEELLGCIGNSHSLRTLPESVGELTLEAALDDPRFRPAAEEHGAIDIEISVLTPLRRIRGPRQFCVGRHGALLRLGAHSALLLPQVAHSGWTAETFLEALSRKSTLGTHAWKHRNARLYAFEAQVFSRPGLRGPS